MTHQCVGYRGAGNSGFTLIEVLTALVVMGVATSIFFGLFAASISLGNASRGEKVAAQLAVECLADLQTHPAQFSWPAFGEVEHGELLPIPRAGEEDAPLSQAAPPAVMPTEKGAHDRERNFYRDFTSEAFARLPSEGANYVDVVVVIHWVQEGRKRLLSLTSCMPRAAVEGLS